MVKKYKYIIGLAFIIIIIFSSDRYSHTTNTITSKNNIANKDIKVELDQNDIGLIIKGRSPEKSIYLWLKDSKDLNLPPIGWGNQFGHNTLNTQDSCLSEKADNTHQIVDNIDECKKWYQKQIKFREEFKKLFVRQWQMNSDTVGEKYASVAYSALSDYTKDNLKTLRPTSTPTIKFSDNKINGDYTFEIHIPWESLPPMSSLTLKDINIFISLSDLEEKDIKYQTMTLPSSREYYITSCKYELGNNYGVSKPIFSDLAVPYIIPSKNLNINKTIMIDNTTDGYQYDPNASSTSPTAYEIDNYFEKNISRGETICGSQLSFIKNNKIIKTDISVSSTTLGIKHISNDEILVKNGPYSFYSYYGVGQCGMCVRGALNITYMNMLTGTSTTSYNFYTVFDANDVDFVISPDWKKLIKYEFGPKEEAVDRYDSDKYIWTSISYCYNDTAHIYEECASNKNATPPSPRHFSPKLDDN